jgi:hypothetical protein
VPEPHSRPKALQDVPGDNIAEGQALSDWERAEFNEVLEEWYTRCRIALSAYNQASTRTDSSGRRLGMLAVAFTAIVATSVFATLTQDPSTGWRIATGVLAAAAAVLSALQTFLHQAERSERFLEAARNYGRLRRLIERRRAFPPATRGEARAVLNEIELKAGEAALSKPNVPQSIWDRAEFRIKGSSDARGVKALRLRVRESLDFGVARTRRRLPQEHEVYFCDLAKARLLSVTDVRPGEVRLGSVTEARRRMLEARGGARDRRQPLDVRRLDDGTYEIVDGKATFAVALREKWATVPVRILNSPESSEDCE